MRIVVLARPDGRWRVHGIMQGSAMTDEVPFALVPKFQYPFIEQEYNAKQN
jgi:hypothetical protein